MWTAQEILWGMLSASDFVEGIRDVNSFEKTELTLYFSNAAGDGLVEEKREVMRNTNTSLEKLIVEQLIEGPREPDSYPTLPPDMKLLNVMVSESVCSINLDSAFLNNSLEVKGIYSHLFDCEFTFRTSHGQPGADPHQWLPGRGLPRQDPFKYGV